MNNPMTGKHLAAAKVHMMLNSEYPCSYCYRSPHLRDLVTLYSVLQCTGPIEQKMQLRIVCHLLLLLALQGGKSTKQY